MSIFRKAAAIFAASTMFCAASTPVLSSTQKETELAKREQGTANREQGKNPNKMLSINSISSSVKDNAINYDKYRQNNNSNPVPALRAIRHRFRSANPFPVPLLSQANNMYQKAKEELTADWYPLYRIVDRISRANNLDDKNWRIRIIPSYQINAFATEVNLIALYNGLLDQFAGDSSAIACVVAHEFEHHVERHIALTPVQIAEEKKKIEIEAAQQLEEEIKSARGDMLGSSIGGGVMRIFGGAIGGSAGAAVSNIGSNAANTATNARSAAAQRRINEIIAEKEKNLTQSIAETSRKHEFEADEGGLKLMTTAGFDPKGCLRVMNVLKNTPNAEFDTTHPAIPKRIDRLNELISTQNKDYLVLEGKRNLYETKPLTYDLSKDRLSLRADS